MNGAGRNSTTSHFGRMSVGGLGGKLKAMSKKKNNEATQLQQLSQQTFDTLEIWTVDNKPILIELARLKLFKLEKDILVRDVVKAACQTLGIAPRTASFFGICSGTNWLIQSHRLESVPKKFKIKKYILMLQFKVLLSSDMRSYDEVAYQYYVKQCRYIFKSGGLAKQLEGKENEKILLRMVILEMMIVSKEENGLSLKEVMKSKNRKIFSMEEILKSYNDRDGPRDVSKCKQKVEKSLNCFSKVTEPDKDFVTEVELLTHYREEVFHVKKYEGDRPNYIELWVTPNEILKRAIIGKVKMTLWQSLYASFHRFKEVSDDVSEAEQPETEKKVEKIDRGKKIMVLRGDEPPEMIYCTSEEQVESLFSYVEGYYQLLVNQYDSLIFDSCDFLRNGESHGPIEREVALRILTSKGRERGTYLIREHTLKYENYVMSLIKDDDDFAHILIKMEVDGTSILYKIDDQRTFKSLLELQDFYKDEDNANEIKTCLQKCILPKNAGLVPLYTNPMNFRPPPPSRKHLLNGPNQISMPCLLDASKISMRKHIKMGAFGDVLECEAEISEKIGKEVIIVKRYPTLKSEMLNEVAIVLMQIQNHARILPFIGISITNDLSLAFEYLPLGSMEQFLESHRTEITYGQLLKYMWQITDAVLYLHHKNLIHADLRLSKFLMKSPQDIKLSDCCITWKLSRFKKLDERIFQKRYKFLAPEIFLQQNQEFTRKTDVWAYGLTIWQLFTLQRPFKNCTSPQLMQFFLQHMKIPQQPALIHLNMNILPYCPSGLFDVFSHCLSMLEKERWYMDKIFRHIEEFKRKVPSCHKDQLYFVYDWESDDVLKEVKENSKLPLPPDYGSVGSGDSTWTLDSGYDGRYKDLNEVDGSVSGGSLGGGSTYSTLNREIKTEATSMDEDDGVDVEDGIKARDRRELSPLKEDALSPDQLIGPMETSTASSPSVASQPPSPTDVITQRSKTDEKMDVDITSVPSPITSVSLESVRSSHSAPASPTRPSRLSRSISANNEKRGEEDLETASILVGMSQTKLPNKASNPPTTKPPAATTTTVQPIQPHPRQPVFCVPPGFSLVGPIRGPPVPFLSQQHTIQPTKNVPPQTLPRPVAPKQTPPKKEYQPRSPQPPPPDSPDSTRRDFPDPPRREIPRDDKTRAFLQEKINKERDRYRGKRSISFNEEFDEYKSTTRKAAKRALLGSNPFNLGIKIPDNFLLRSEKRPYPTVRPDIIKFFNTSLDKYQPPNNGEGLLPKLLPNGAKMPSSSPYDPYKTLAELESSRNSRPFAPPTLLPQQQHPPSSALDPYKTAEDLKKYRQTTLMKANEESRKAPTSEIQTVVQGIQDMHAHSPKDMSYEENRRITDNRRVFIAESSRPDISSASTAVTTTVNVFSSHPQHGISSIFMPVQQVRFPYGHPADPSQIPFNLPPTSMSGVRASKKGIATGYSGYILPMHVHQERPRLAPAVPILTMNPGPYGPRIPVSHAKYPPNLHRFTANAGVIYASEQPRFSVADQPYSPIPTSTHRPLETGSLPSSAFKQPEKTKTEPDVPKFESVISCGKPTVIKKEEDDTEYTSRNKQRTNNDYTSFPNQLKGPISPGGLFSPQPGLFRTPIPRVLSKKQILREDLKYDRKKDLLGKGQFGAVYKATWLFTDPTTNMKKEVDVAVKTLHGDNPLTKEALEDLRKEADAMAILTSENISEGAKHIIKLYGICSDPNGGNNFSIVTERAHGGALNNYIYKNKHSLGESGVGYCLFYGKQIACGMEYLHNRKIIHRDLACRNILVMEKELVKITDFGLSRIFTETNYYRSKTERKVPVPWMATESIGEHKYTIETDYWSYGVTLWELFTILDKDYRKHFVLPYEAEGIESQNLLDFLLKGNRLSKPKLCPEKLWTDVILPCWNEEPSKRPSFYISGLTLKKLMTEIEFCLG